MIFSRYLLFIVFIIVFHVVSAQFTDTTPYYLNFNSNGVINNTNEGNSFVLNNNLKFSVSKKRIAANASAGWLYGKQAGELTNNDFTTLTDVNFLKSVKTLYYWSFAGYDKSLSLQITDKFQTGAGMGYHVFKREKLKVVLSDGILYEYNDLYTLAPYRTVRNSLRVKFNILFSNIVALEGTTFIQNSFKDANDYIILSNTGLSLKLNEWLRFNSSLVYNRVNINARQNLQCTFGLIFERYFRHL